jgi:amidase
VGTWDDRERDAERRSGSCVGWTAQALADAVRRGDRTAVEVTDAHLDHLAAVEHRLGAFVAVRRRAALDEAADVDGRADRADLPLAGVPVAVKDIVDVAGEATRHGSPATSAAPASEDHPLVTRLREAGAIVLGKTRCPELSIWGTSADPAGTAVSPWDPTRTAGGSSGGSGAAVAAGVTPVALASDGLGSIRIPAAATGTVGFRPGADHLPEIVEGEHHWFGMSRFGPIATTVTDTALLFDALTGEERARSLRPPEDRLRVAVSWRSPFAGVKVTRPWIGAAIEAGRLLRADGHDVDRADPPYDTPMANAILARWTQGVARDVEVMGLDPAQLQPRTRAHVTAGRRGARFAAVEPAQAERWRGRVRPFFEEHDVLITPALARTPPRARAWYRRSWMANLMANAAAYPFASTWNLADLPALVLPLWHDRGRPLSVQVVAGPGREDLVLAMARQLEQLAPWRRHAPGWGVPE